MDAMEVEPEEDEEEENMFQGKTSTEISDAIPCYTAETMAELRGERLSRMLDDKGGGRLWWNEEGAAERLDRFTFRSYQQLIWRARMWTHHHLWAKDGGKSGYANFLATACKGCHELLLEQGVLMAFQL